MRGWSETRFEAARQLRGTSGTVWLESRPAPGSSAMRRVLGRAGRRIGRFSSVVFCGVGLAAFAPGLALAPVGSARASVESLLPRPEPAASVWFPRRSFADGGLAEPRRLEGVLRFGSRELPRSLVETIVRAADTTGVDAIYLMALADKESSFRADVRAPTSSAEGLYQFIDRTWLDVVRRWGADHGLAMEADAVTLVDERPVVEDESMRARILELRREPYLAAVMAAEMLKRDAAEIGFRTGRALGPTEMYLAHFLGLEDAARFITLLDARKPPSAAKVFPAAARANAAIFFERRKRRLHGLTVPEVYGRIQSMIDSRVARYRDVQVAAGATGS